jgi:hypothetical protein
LKIFFIILITTLSSNLFGQIDSTSNSANEEVIYFIDDEEENSETEEVSRIGFLSGIIGQIRPQKAFKNKLVSKPINFGISFQYQLTKNKPIFLGTEFNYCQIGSFSGDVEIDTEFGLELWNSSTSSSLKSFDLNARYYLPIGVGKLDVFGEFNLGVHWFSTRTTLIPPGSETSEGNYDKNDLVGKYGVNLGLHYPFGPNGYFQIRFGYQPGLSAYYYTKRQPLPSFVEYTIDAFSLTKSTTDAIKWDLGYTFAF